MVSDHISASIARVWRYKNLINTIIITGRHIIHMPEIKVIYVCMYVCMYACNTLIAHFCVVTVDPTDY